MKKWFSSNYQHFIIIGIFLLLCFIYFSPVLSGKVLYQGDVIEAKSMSKEIMDVKAKTGTGPLWTNSMFGGMPSFQIWAKYPGNITTYVIDLLNTVFPDPINIIICFFLGSYFLLHVLRMKPWLAAAGSIAFTFSSYNFIYILAGHSNHAMAMAFFAPILAAILLTLRGGKYLFPGSLLTAFFLALEIRTNHIQMTYYLFMIIMILILIELYNAITTKKTREFFKAFGCLALAAVLAVAINAGALWSTWQYGQESIRGKAILSSKNNKTDAGLDRSYVYQYSQGVGEIGTFLIPDLYGGASSSKFPDGPKSVKEGLTKSGIDEAQAQNVVDQLVQANALRPYWGDKPGTAGSWYFGAIVIFLFILGLFIVNNRIKWWIVSTSFLFIFLSFGQNFPLISDLFFDYFPMYNKFRSVDFTLAIPAFLFPLLAFLALQEIMEQKDKRKDLQKKLLYSFYITAGILLIVLLLPNLLFDFKPASHNELINQLSQAFGGNPKIANIIGNGLVEDRISLARADALRSLIFVGLGFAVIWYAMKSKLSNQYAAMILGVLILVDMWQVDRRYLNNDNFYSKYQMEQNNEPTSADQAILADKTLDFRVIDLTRGNPFFDASASYFHKSVGGRHSARLRRYDDLVSNQFNGKMNEPILDMLNTKYAIISDTATHIPKAIIRPGALGNAWFVNDIKYVRNADEEMQAITDFKPGSTAVVDETFRTQIGQLSAEKDPAASITLKSYLPDHLVYDYITNKDELAVFAEIWYDKGWNAYLDGKIIPYLRANYVLRAAKLPAGKHELEFKFEPDSYLIGDRISLFASILLVLAAVFATYRHFKRSPEN